MVRLRWLCLCGASNGCVSVAIKSVVRLTPFDALLHKALVVAGGARRCHRNFLPKGGLSRGS